MVCYLTGPELLPDRAARDRFLREGTTWVQLGKHPHIVRCHRVFKADVGLEVFFVLDLVAAEGKRDASLRSWLILARPFWIEQTASSLQNYGEIMSNSSTSSQKPRHIWLIPAIIAFVAVVIEVTGNLVANELDAILKPYHTVVWVIFGTALIVAVVAAIWETRRTPEPSISNDPALIIQQGNVSVSGDVKESIIVTGDRNFVKTSK